MKEKCPKCKSKMNLIKTKVDLPRGSFDLEGYKCPKCGEEIFTHEQAVRGEKISMAKGIWGPGLWLERKVTTIGGSPAIVIPKDIAKQLKMNKGKNVKIGLLDDEIIIKPERQAK